MKINQDILKNIIIDFSKKDVTPYEKGKLIIEYLKENNLSLRQLSREIGISHTTLQTWISFYKNLKPNQYEDLIESGIPKAEIYRIASAKYKGLNTNPLDIILSRTLFIISKNPPITDETKKRAYQVIQKLNDVINK